MERRLGGGTFVIYRQAVEEHEIAEETSPLQLIEVRMAIEPQIARFAVLHASNRDLEPVSAALGGPAKAHDNFPRLLAGRGAVPTRPGGSSTAIRC